MRRLRPAITVLPLVLTCLGGVASAARGEDSLAASRVQLYADYRQKLTALAEWCDEADLNAAARRLRGWLPRREPNTTYLFVLDEARQPEAEVASGPEREFRERWQKLRADEAQSLLALAQRAAGENRPSLAYELLTEAARENRKLKPAWRILGYVDSGGVWRTPFEAQQLATGKVWHPKFGWLPAAHVARYEKGERFYHNRWMPAAEEARLRGDISDGWQVETDHYLVTTNHSLAAGVELAERLEQFYSIWQQAFAGYLTSDAELTRRLASGRPGSDRDKLRHKVIYYRTRDEYNAALRSAQPRIAMTLGIYFDSTRKAYFFAGDDQEAGTLYHEATHQLFQETREVAPEVGREDNFWIVEAVACYMESLERRGDYFTLGGSDAGRMLAARQRLLQDKFYVPLDELVPLGMLDLQRHADISKLYTESAGLATFLMDRHPEATVQYLRSVYAGNADRDTLARLSGHSLDDLDQEYRAFITSLAKRAGG